MNFRPEVGHQLNIEGTLCTIAGDPTTPALPYKQEGREAIVYQLLSPHQEKLALKVFKEHYRSPDITTRRAKMIPFATLPGLQVCQSTVLTPQLHQELLDKYPDLAYAVLMPWIDGPTWQAKLRERQPLAQAQSLFLARTLASNLAIMEKEGLAHCNLSSGNLMIPYLFKTVTVNQPLALVDLEQMYGPDFAKPLVTPGGSAGYMPVTIPAGLWDAEADRFAGAILLAEILGWCDPEICRQAAGESYFTPAEIQRSSSRYDLLQNVLSERWGKELAGQFARAWQSKTLADCPSFAEWLAILPEKISTVKALLEVEIRDKKAQQQSGVASSQSAQAAFHHEEAKVDLPNSVVCPQCKKQVTGGWINCPFCEAPLFASDNPMTHAFPLKPLEDNRDAPRQVSSRTKNSARPGPAAPAGPAVFSEYRRSTTPPPLRETTNKQTPFLKDRKYLVALGALSLLIICGSCGGLSWFVYTLAKTQNNVAAAISSTTQTPTVITLTPFLSVTPVALLPPTSIVDIGASVTPIAGTPSVTLTPVPTMTGLPTVTPAITDTQTPTITPTTTATPESTGTPVPTSRPTRPPLTNTPLLPRPTNTAVSTAHFPALAYRFTAVGSGKALEDPAYSGANGANITLNGWTGSQNQQWAIDDLGNGYFRIINKYSGKVLEDPAFSGANETFIVQHDWNSGANQQWEIIYQNNGFFAILNKYSGKALEDWKSAGTNVDQYDWHGGLNQLWRLSGL